MELLSFTISLPRLIYENTLSALTSTTPIYMRTDMAITPIVLTCSTTAKLTMDVLIAQGFTTRYTNMGF